MKKMNKKGFTIVELVIVIAVIAILAAVLIPTFSGIVTKAQNSAALQEARNIYTEVYALDIADGTLATVEAGQDGTVTIADVTLPTGAKITEYEVTNKAVSSFKYTASNSINVSFNGSQWTVPAQ